MRRLVALLLVCACGGKPPAPPPAPPAVPKPEPPATTNDASVPQQTTISGRVLDAAGKPVAGAVVALVLGSSAMVADVTVSDAGGGYRFTAPEGEYGITVTSSAGEAYYLDVRAFAAPAVTGVDLPLGSGGFRLTGRID